jgi:cytochrome c oxidase assembly factor CtaG
MLCLSRHPLLAAYLHGAVIWFWHTPHFYMLAVRNPWWHIVEHACFLVTAGLFWWALLNANTRRLPWALLALLLTLMHTGILGALLTFARAPLYGEVRDLADQQLAGLIMWVLGAIPYIGASAWLGHRWYRQILRRIGGAPELARGPEG